MVDVDTLLVSVSFCFRGVCVVVVVLVAGDGWRFFTVFVDSAGCLS